MKIAGVHLRGFQDHEDTHVDFDDGINVVVGTSNGGKSAVLRGIAWVLSNRPDGDGFINLCADSCSVTVTFDNGTQVERIRDRKGYNGYKIRYTGQPEIECTSIGKGIPVAALEAMGNPPTLKDAEGRALPLYYHAQKMPDFLVTSGPTQLPRDISALVGLDDLEMTAKELASLSRRYNTEASAAKERVDRLERELAQFAGLDEDLELLSQQEAIKAQIDATVERSRNASELARRADSIHTTGSRAYAALKAAKAIAVHRPKIDALNDKQERVTSAVSVLNKHVTAGRRIADAELIVSAKANIASDANKAELHRLHLAVTQRGDAALIVGNHVRLSAQLSSALETLRQNETALTSLAEARTELLAEMIEAGVMCKDCGQLIKEAA